MLQNPALKAEFFTRIDSALIFQKERFLDFLKLRILDSSYTKFANKIGLSINSDLLKNALLKGQTNVVLNFPYKDCVLKGAQSKDSDKSDEIFFNEILASDEIDILFKPKALQRFELVSVDSNKSKDFELIKSALQNRRSIFDEKSGLCSHEQGNKTKVSMVASLRSQILRIDEASGKLHDLSQKDKPSTPNLLIKGNNLLALHTLKSRRDIYGQVKLIYIDPPYNTGNDSFNYNDRFNHSAWLVFMKNRLEVAREFLREDGVIFIQCDDNEQAYLKVLCDEIFGRENFVNCIAVKLKNIAGASGGGEDKRFKKNIEYILIYAKSYERLEQFKSVYDTRELYSHINFCKENNISWKYTAALLNGGEKKLIATTLDGDGNEIKIFERSNYQIKSIGQIAKDYKISEKEVFYQYIDKIFRTTIPQSSIRTRVLEKLQNLNLNPYLISIEYTPKSGRNKGILYEQFYNGDKLNLFAWLKDVVEIKEKQILKRELIGTLWDFAFAMTNLTKEGSVQFGNAKKPEALLQRILELTTKEGDLVMDFFAGSGTTCAVAHKMNRRWIGIEQMDYVEGITKERLIKVINGEQGGISKAVGWNPLSPSLAEGELPKNESLLDCHTERSEVSQDSRDFSHSTNAQNDKNVKPLELPKNAFIYCELMPLNALYKDKIAKSSSDGELARIYDELQTKAFIDYRVDIKEMLKDRDFEALPLADKKQILYAILDSNMDYVAYSDMEDSNFCVDKEVQGLNRAFFKGGENG